MPLTAVKPSQIRKIAALSLVGNATGAEARGTSLSASQVRTLLGLGTVDSPSFSGMTLSGHLLFNATNTYDVGNGTYDPRTVRAATSVLSPLFNNPAAAATTLGNSTYGVTVPGDIVVGTKVTPALNMDSSGTTNNEGPVIRFQKNGANKWAWFMPASSLNCELYGFNASANAISVTPTNDITLGATLTVPATATIGAASVAALNLNSSGTTSVQGAILRLQKNGSSKWGVWMPADTENFGIYNFATSSFAMTMTPAGAATFSGDISMQKATQGYIRAYGTGGVNNIAMYDDNTNGILSTSSGALYLSPNSGEVYTANIQNASATLTLGNSTYGITSPGGLVMGGNKAIRWGSTDILTVYNGHTYLDSGNGYNIVLRPTTPFLVCLGGVTSSYPALQYSGSTLKARLADNSADAAFTCAGITASGLIKGEETTSTPSGTTQTITLATGNCQTLDLTSSTGDVTATLTVPASSARGSLLIKQHATTSRDITWAASSGTITWLGTEPTWNADATSAYREVEWRFNGTNTFLIASGSS